MSQSTLAERTQNDAIPNNQSSNISQVCGNSPLLNIPSDYCPTDSGHWFIIPEGLDAGKKLFFYDAIIGTGTPEATIVCVHGNPECSYSYRHVVNQLRQHSKKSFRLVVMDHIGFGRSDQASYEMVDMHHANNLQQLIQHLDLQHVTLVIHDWGGPIGVGAFIHEPERVDHLIVLNTTVFPLSKTGLTYENYPFPFKLLSWSAGGKNIPDILWKTHAAFSIHATPGTYLSLVSSYIGYFIKSAFNRIPEADMVYKDMLSTAVNARSSKRMVQQTPVWGHGYSYLDPTLGQQDNHDFYRYLQNNISKVWGPEGKNIPTRLLFGEWDPLSKPSAIQQWLQALPQLKNHIQIFQKVSHFVAEHKAPEVAQAILDVAELKS